MPRGGRCSIRCTSFRPSKTIRAQPQTSAAPATTQGQPQTQAQSTPYQPQLLKQTVALVRSLDWNTLKWPAGISRSQTFKSWWNGSKTEIDSTGANDAIDVDID